MRRALTLGAGVVGADTRCFARSRPGGLCLGTFLGGLRTGGNSTTQSLPSGSFEGGGKTNVKLVALTQCSARVGRHCIGTR